MKYSFFQPLVFMMPIVVICFFFIMHKDKVDLQQSVMSVTLALGFNGFITDILKLIVGTLLPENLSAAYLHQINWKVLITST